MQKILLLGSGELGKEVVIELKRYGQYVIAVDRYQGAPAASLADESYVINMTDSDALSALIKQVQPDIIVPEIEAIATDSLRNAGSRVVPSRQAVELTMNREGIRRLAAEELGLPTSPYRFASSYAELQVGADEIGYPVVIKPVQSSSGKGQSVAKSADDLTSAWETAQLGARGGGSGVQRVIVEGFVEFDYEITLLTCSAVNGISFCEPIGHQQVDGDYRTSWQPQLMTSVALERAQSVATKIVQALSGDGTSGDTGWGIFGVELFIKGDDVIFSEVSPRPHDTGMVTMISQNVSEFALHARAILGLPVYPQQLVGPAASYAIIAEGHGVPVVELSSVSLALNQPNSDVRIFGKPQVDGERRVAVALAVGDSVADAINSATTVGQQLDVRISTRC
jgi:phosphoribosylglycinamide formyltransferase 2